MDSLLGQERLDMRWEQRRPVWPLMGGLACLFGLAVAAPYCWQHPVLNVHQLIERRQIARPVEIQQLPPRPTFDFDTLRGMHAALQEDDRSAQKRAAPPAPCKPNVPRVIVTSENDRLAMLDTRPSQTEVLARRASTTAGPPVHGLPMLPRRGESNPLQQVPIAERSKHRCCDNRPSC